MSRGTWEAKSLIDPDELTKDVRRDAEHAMTAEGTSARARRDRFKRDLVILAAVFAALALAYAYLIMQHW